MKYLKEFENHSQYEEELFNLPKHNVSICDDEDGVVHYDDVVNRTVIFTYISNAEHVRPNVNTYDRIEKMFLDDNELDDYYSYDIEPGEHVFKIVLTKNVPSTIQDKEDTMPACIQHNSGIISVTLPSTITRISSGAFEECVDLTTVICKNHIVDIQPFAFKKTKIKSFDFSYVKIIEHTAFAETLLEGEIKLPMIEILGREVFSMCNNIESVVIGNNVKYLEGSNTFEKCTNLNSFIISGGTYDTIGIDMFKGCTNLSSVSIRGNNLHLIQYNAFDGCENLRTLNIFSKRLSEIRSSFADCNDSFTMYVRSWNVPTLSAANAFGVPREGLRIRVLRSRGDVYKAAENWSNYADNIQANLPR